MDEMIFKIVAVGVVAAILAIIVKKESPAFALVITLAASVLIFFMIIPRLSAAIDLLRHIADNIDSGAEYLVVALKIIGIAYAAEFGASICVDAGETSIASKIELAGKVMIMGVSAPVIFSLLNLVLSVLP